MFGKFMNNYYYGKSGKGDYNPEDLPKTRWQLFLEMLRTRLSGLCRLNLIYVLPWLPTILVLAMMLTNWLNVAQEPEAVRQTLELMEADTSEWRADGSVVITDDEGGKHELTAEAVKAYKERQAAYDVDDELAMINGGDWQDDGSVIVTTQQGKQTYTKADIEALIEQDRLDTENGYPNTIDRIKAALFWALVALVPCLFITGPWTAGMSYVTRNWARDEHAFIWSDFKDAMKENWKGSLVISAITAIMPLLVYLCWEWYGNLTANSTGLGILLQLGQMVPVMVGVVWSMAVLYTYPMLVTYKMSVKTVLRNSLILAVGRLPQSLGIRLLHCVPVLLGTAIFIFVPNLWVPILLMLYYVVFGFGLSRFITASFTNAQFDRFINSRIEGAKVNQGLNTEDDDEDWEDEEEEVVEKKPWENGYVDR